MAKCLFYRGKITPSADLNLGVVAVYPLLASFWSLISTISPKSFAIKIFSEYN